MDSKIPPPQMFHGNCFDIMSDDERIPVGSGNLTLCETDEAAGNDKDGNGDIIEVPAADPNEFRRTANAFATSSARLAPVKFCLSCQTFHRSTALSPPPTFKLVNASACDFNMNSLVQKPTDWLAYPEYPPNFGSINLKVC